MKVMQINCVYKKGSTGKIVYDLHNGLIQNNIDAVVCYGRGEKTSDLFVYKTCSELYSKLNKVRSYITGIMYGGCFISTKKLIKIIKQETPDIVHLQCINGYFVNIYELLKYLKNKKIKTVITLHAEFMYTGGCGYSIDCDQWSTHEGCGHPGCPRWRDETLSLFFDNTAKMWKKMNDAFVGFDDLVIVSVSQWLMNRAKSSQILKDKNHCVVFNGLDTNIFHKYICEKSDKKVVFHASPNFSDDPNHIKGGYYVLELAKRMKDVQFIIAGPYNIKGSIPDNVKMLGRISNQKELAMQYARADITLMVSQRETFSMVCAESLCCGTPVVGFKAGAPEQISLAEYSEFVEYGNISMLENAVRKWLNTNIDERTFKEAKNRYSKDTMIKEYIAIYNSMIEDKNGK